MLYHKMVKRIMAFRMKQRWIVVVVMVIMMMIMMKMSMMVDLD